MTHCNALHVHASVRVGTVVTPGLYKYLKACAVLDEEQGKSSCHDEKYLPQDPMDMAPIAWRSRFS